jgi:serine/threonine-protein kinase
VARAAAKEEVRAGDLLGGKYRIERVIGQGGMGVVAAARHTELHQRVAIKVLPLHLASDKDLVERFMREARAAARLRSEHAVKVVDVGTRSNGSPYIVMELLEGEDLGKMLERGPLRVADAVDFILQACEAVAEAHSLGIVHRDLKPTNLFLSTKLDGKALVKVLDFGLAKRVDMQDRALTATTAVMGSPQYMSPEQMKASRDVDFRTDVWSLGVCLYELVSTRLPFDAVAVPVLCAMVLKDDPIPLPSVRPDVPLALWGVIRRCLMKDPTQRYATISELAKALEPLAPPHALGAADRIHAVLHAVSDASGAMLGTSGSLEHGAEAATITRVDAASDSNPHGGPASRWLLPTIVAAVLAGLALAGIILVVQARRHPIAREPAHYEPDVAELAGALPRAKVEGSSSPQPSAGLPSAEPITGGAPTVASAGDKGKAPKPGTITKLPKKTPDPNAKF